MFANKTMHKKVIYNQKFLTIASNVIFPVTMSFSNPII